MELTGWHWAGIAGAAGAAALGVWRLLRGAAEADASEEITAPGVPADDADVYAVARVLASEAGGQARVSKIAVGWVVKNEAARRGISPLALVLDKGTEFGPQGSGGRGFVASSNAPTKTDRDLAAAILADLIADPTDGATAFYSPRLLDRQYAAGKVKQSDSQRAAMYTARGYEEAVVPGMNDDFRFWRRAA